MKKTFNVYVVTWAIILAAFNLLCFITPDKIGNLKKIDATFWVSYAFITMAFIGQLVVSYFAFKAENLKKMFYNMSLIMVSYGGTIIMLIFAVLAMVIPNLPSWIGAVVCIIILAFSAVAVLKASVAVNLVEKIDNKIATKTTFIRNLSVKAESLMNRAKSEAAKQECRKVYEEIRYSDPMSNDALSVIEAKITVKFDELRNMVGVDDTAKIKDISDELILLIGERNNKCRLLK